MENMLDFASKKDQPQKDRMTLLIIKYIGSILDYVDSKNVHDLSKNCTLL